MIKQVILFRKDLHMRAGKICAQTAHASLKVFFDRQSQAWWARLLRRIPFLGRVLIIPLTDDMAQWVDGKFAKIVLSVSCEGDLIAAYRLAEEAGLPCSLIQDMGATEFHGVPTYTTVAIGPARAELIDPITGPSGAVKTTLA